MKVSIKIAVIVFLVISACIVGYSMLPGEEEAVVQRQEQNINYEKLEEVIFDVQTDKVIRGELVKTITANGIIRANREIDIIPNADGFIEKVNVYDGKHVSKGELLVKLDDREASIELQEREANLTKANADFAVELKNELLSEQNEDKKVKLIEKEKQFLKSQLDKGEITKEQYDIRTELLGFMKIYTGNEKIEVIKSRTGLNAARVSRERARLQLSYTKITAPFSGVVGNFDLVVGQRINRGTELFKLFDIEKLRIEVGVLENEISSIKSGNLALVKLNALPGREYSGRVVSVSPYIDPETKTCRVIIELQNKDLEIKPGMFASVSIESAVLNDRVLIPKEALLIRDQRSLVFTVEGDLAKWKYVETGEYNDRYHEIKSGVNPGEEIIIKGHYTLAHDAKIKIIKQ